MRRHGPAAAVLEAWRSERFGLLISPAILDEIARVLAYPKIARRHHWSTKEIRAFVQELGELSVIHEDPDDDRYLECAMEGEAEYIVSGDRHLHCVAALNVYNEDDQGRPRRRVSVAFPFSPSGRSSRSGDRRIMGARENEPWR